MGSYHDFLWAENLGEGLGRHPTSNYGSVPDNPENQTVITEQRIRSNIIGLLIKKSLTTDTNRKLRGFRYAYTFNTQYDGSAIFAVIVNMMQRDTCTG